MKPKMQNYYYSLVIFISIYFICRDFEIFFLFIQIGLLAKVCTVKKMAEKIIDKT